MRRYVMMVLMAAAVSCRDATSPLEISGSWHFTFTDMSGTSMLGDLTCQGTSFDFVIAQDGSTFSGTQTGTASLDCTSHGQPAMSSTVLGETIVAGVISGNTVTFRMGSISSAHFAEVSGPAMSGTAMWDFSPSPDVVLHGTFTATRQ